MTPQEKSKELVDKFLHPVRWKMGQEDVKERAKQCALIAVNHMKSMLDGLHKPEYCAFDAIGERKFTFEGEYPDHMTGYDMLEYLEQVKQEIEKL